MNGRRYRRRGSRGLMVLLVAVMLVWATVVAACTAHFIRATSFGASPTAVVAVEYSYEHYYENTYEDYDEYFYEYTPNPFGLFPFFVAHLQLEYEEFYIRHPYLDYEYVVWKVNAGLNRPFFKEAELTTGLIPLLVNPFNRLPYDFVPHALVSIDEAGRLATPEKVAAFNTMQRSAAQDGFNLVVVSAFRDIPRQVELFEQAGGFQFVYNFCYIRQESISEVRLPLSVAPPGFSEHHTGRALDLMGVDGGLLDAWAPSAMGQWVAENAHRYGFIVRYKPDTTYITGYISEPWHITYVGTSISGAMHFGGYRSLEEFVGRNPEYLHTQ